eukprot:TRINITY_DN10043_c0_g1_i2.p1 TRINITY_DN10043_c0_g1~~TRINITY_DN10043_c0_g1_i2.p1  ORF type:complete len:441 (+),score=102.15 TRINITY_DN10043_c0_g1_i2:27-1325(+)
MAAFILISAKEQLTELAAFFSSFSEDVGAKAKALAEADDLAGAYTLLVANVDALLEQESGVESVLNSLARLAQDTGSEHSDALVRAFSTAIAGKQTAHSDARIRALANLFNSIPTASHNRYVVYFQVVQLASNVDRLALIEAQLPSLDKWLDTWSVTMAERRDMYRALQQAFKAAGKLQLSQQYLIKLLRTYNDAGDDAKSVATEAKEALAYAMAARTDFDVFVLENITAIAQLKGQPLYDAFNAFRSADYNAYLSAVKQDSDMFTQFGLDTAAAERRVRLMVLANMCATQAELSFDDIAKAIDVKEDQVEEWIIDVVRANLVEAKVDELERKVVITRATQSRFTTQDWSKLKDTLTVRVLLCQMFSASTQACMQLCRPILHLYHERIDPMLRALLPNRNGKKILQACKRLWIKSSCALHRPNEGTIMHACI